MAVIGTLAATLAVTLARTVLVLDAVFSTEKTSVVARSAKIIRSKNSSVAPGSLTSTSPGPQQLRRGVTHPRGSKARSLHLKLVAMHVAAAVGQAAALLKYTLPVSDTSCRVTDQIMIIFTVFYDASLVTFLLAKVDVINANRTPVCWEKVVIWVSRAFAWIYLPVAAVVVGFAYADGANDEGTFCYNSDDDSSISSNASGYASSNALLIVQFVLLLAIFVKPMLAHQGDTQSGRALYRKVVLRNIWCTSSICVAYMFTTAIMVSAILRESSEDNMYSQVVDAVARINMLVTLCLTEIALPIGFASCWKSMMRGSEDAQRAGDVKSPTTNCRPAAGGTTLPNTVIPLEEEEKAAFQMAEASLKVPPKGYLRA